MAAYDVQAFQVNAPDWAPTTRYDIRAKVPAGTTKSQVRIPWQNLLRDRLRVVVHHAFKEFQIYELTVAKGGPKMKETDLPRTVEPFDFAASSPKFGQNGALEIDGTGSVVTVMPIYNRMGGPTAKPPAGSGIGPALRDDLISSLNSRRISRACSLPLELSRLPQPLRAIARAIRAPTVRIL